MAPSTIDIVTLYEVRNCFVHTDGVIGDIFARRNKDYSSHVGKKIKIDTRFVDEAKQCLISSVKQIDEIVLEKFGVASEHKTIDDVLKSITDTLPTQDKLSSSVISKLSKALELKEPSPK